MSGQQEFERLLERVARDYNPPPATPREEMWTAIQRRRESGRERDVVRLDTRRARRRGIRSYGPLGLAIAVAATLVVGFGLGRVTADRGIAPAPGAVTDAPAHSLPVQLAAARHMGEAEAMLTLFRTSGDPDDTEATARWARDLLTTTRLMMDSRAAADPRMAQLLGDLELVLVQIAHAGTGAGEKELIEEGIEQRQLITKLRAASGDPLERTI